ncbi:hypothetical protein LOD99_4463 [Oopsacas minuta]|uniref:Uncharacterized protein n=1 Tax=Oopsacas minuta TaxID=111878 RepID=A0AAV7JVE4_9METZ|nr:hypothetical protein LOD99_4463 [Oopsacas minuta]
MALHLPDNRERDQDKNNHVKICVIFGPKIPPSVRRGMFLLLTIVALQRFFYYSYSVLLSDMLTYSMKVSNNDYTFTLLQQVPLIFSSPVGLCCDLLKFRRGRLVHFSLFIYLFASVSLLIATALVFYCFTTHHEYPPIGKLSYHFSFFISAFSILAFVLFMIATIIFFPISLVYGLDILFETSDAACLFYLALSYFSFNLGNTFAYIQYFSFSPETNMYQAIILFLFLLLALIIFSVGRCMHLLDDSIVIKTDYSFCMGAGILCQALARFCTCKLRRLPKRRSFFHLANKEYGGSFSNEMVEMVKSMLWLHLNLIMLLPFFGLFFGYLVLFSQQSSVLYMPSIGYNDSSVCDKGHNENIHLSSLAFLDSFTILIFLPLFEYVFYKLTLGYENDKAPWFVNCISRKFLCLRVLQSNLRDAHVKLCNYFAIDSIMKRMYWGLYLAIVGVFASLIVEYIQIISEKIDVSCANPTRHDYVSTLSIFSQIPQYVFFAMFECVTMVGSFQFIYYLCNHHFGSSLKGFFFGLHFSYLALSQAVLAGIFWGIGSFCVDRDCIHCYVHNGECTDYNNLTKTWVVWATVLGALLIVFVFYFFIVHYRQWKLIRAGNQFEMILNEGNDLTDSLLVGDD